MSRDSAAGAAGGGSLDLGTELGWQSCRLKIWPDAREGTVFVKPRLPAKDDGGGKLPTDPRELRERSDRRRRGQMRRYCVANQLRYMWTLTCADQTHDLDEMRRRMALLMRKLRHLLGGRFPYVYVFEQHKSGAWHVHLAVPSYIPHAEVKRLWSHGIVQVANRNRKGDAAGSPRSLGRYLAKYVSKTLDAGESHRHAYEVGQGFQPETIAVDVRTLDDGQLLAVVMFEGEFPAFIYSTLEVPDAEGPPLRWMAWDG